MEFSYNVSYKNRHLKGIVFFICFLKSYFSLK